VGEMELDFTTRNRLAIMHTGCACFAATSMRVVAPSNQEAGKKSEASLSCATHFHAGWSCERFFCAF
jgi:hypothetical protein